MEEVEENSLLTEKQENKRFPIWLKHSIMNIKKEADKYG